MLSKRLFSIEHNPELGSMDIKLRPDPKHLSAEQNKAFNKFIEAIVKELDAFKKENNLSRPCMELQKKEGDATSLRIALPRSHYLAFTQRLARKNLLHFNPISI